ncbi:MAG TPA: amidohydrolase family protein [Candidatus Sulfotelmatobacter sp.]|jgi:predicted TIM-barrel fold metal-dependent hydrolase|nr:amidohydrolase family protein [Candidatus Sulfotelmatobacter sp.]
MTLPRLIDVHHHLIPPAFTREMEARGISEVAGAPLPSWTPEKSVETMNAHGIATAITSLSAPGVYFGDRSAAVLLARACNEYAAEMAGRYPGRFGSFAVLPMPFTQESCEEAVFALDVLKADGIVLLGSSDGRFLGDPQFDELMDELDRRSATVFIHPNLHKSSTELQLAAPGFLVEFPCDTTRAATNLILTGTVEKHPHIRWILAHAGGFLPYIAWRLTLADEIPQLAIKAPEGILSYIRRFYYDTALSPSPFAMAALRELVSPDHILFGSDYPFAPATVTGLEVEALETLTIFDAETKAGIGRDNACALFPRFAGKADEKEGS